MKISATTFNEFVSNSDSLIERFESLINQMQYIECLEINDSFFIVRIVKFNSVEFMRVEQIKDSEFAESENREFKYYQFSIKSDLIRFINDIMTIEIDSF